MSEGYKTAKETLKENFGLPHIIAKAHLKKLENLPPLKNCVGSTLLEFTRHLEIADRTLRGMGPDYVSDLNHSNTFMELNRKLPFFLRESGQSALAKLSKLVEDQSSLIC